jgi:hypothetical protein
MRPEFRQSLKDASDAATVVEIVDREVVTP